MKQNASIFGSVLIIIVLFNFLGCARLKHDKKNTKESVVTWNVNDLKSKLPDGFILLGDPKTVTSPMGEAVHFNGKDEAFFYNKDPLKGLHRYTIELIMRPDAKGPFAQRFFHLGKPNGHRVLMEIRNLGDKWYLDAFLDSITSRTLADSAKTHPVDKWYDVAFVVDNGKMDTYVNGNHELSGRVKFSPFKSGQTSLGVRLTHTYWFKGSVYMVRITPKVLNPNEFLTVKQ